ncbi:MAG: Asp-tRNA(Asn)/Glu-tRNA(Gln) amidotransferase subunit GatA, partial [Ruminococcus sp.]|nr:Asp-tRNA(Asn)/Glu-tRNA(Gln) amidotransferase subunit GatA [Ruminococcus sp.]
AAVAAGESILALGSDTGGSVRQPSSYCGVIGLKPTYGRVSRFGLIAYASSLEQIGPIGKCVKDVAMLQTIISGYDKYDSTSCAHKTEDFYKLLKADVKGLKIGILKEYFSSDINEEIKNSIYNTLSILEKNGAELKVVSIPMSVYALNSYYILASAEASSNLARYDGVKFGYRTPEYNNLSEMYIKTRSKGFGDEVKRRIMLGTFVLSSDYYEDYYKKAKKMQAVISNEFSDILKDCDILVSPTTTDTAFKIGERINNPIKMINNDFLTVAANITGLPAINVPCGKSSKGLPFGMQFISNKFNEQLLLNTAYAYETYIDGFDFGLKLD